MTQKEVCCHCRQVIEDGEVGVRYYGSRMAHAEWRCIDLLQRRFEQMLHDQCGDEEYIRELCKQVLPAGKVDGDTYGVPNTVELVEMLVQRVAELQRLEVVA